MRLRLVALVTVIGVFAGILAWVTGMGQSPRLDGLASRRGAQDTSRDEGPDVLRADSPATGPVEPESGRTAVVPPDTSNATSTFSLRVLSTAGTAIPDLSVLIASTEGTQELVTNEEGLASCSFAPPWRVLTRAEGFAPTRHVVLAQGQSGAQEIKIDRDSVLLQGQCWLDGLVPDRMIELHVIPDSGTLFPESELTDRERDFLGLTRGDHELLRFRSDASGGFLIRGAGLSEHVRVYATGLLTLPGQEGLESVSGYLGKGVALQLPAPGARVHAFSSSHELRGRCVVNGSGVAAEGAGITATVYPTPGSWTYMSTSVGPDGEFVLRSPVPHPSKVDVSVGATFVSRPKELSLTAGTTQFPDLGTILVDPQSFADLQVLGEQESPLAGAKLSISGYELTTDAEGRASVPIPGHEGDVKVTASAWGYATHTESLVLVEGAMQVIHLERSNRLRIALTSRSDGRRLAEYGLRGPMADLGDPTQGSIGAPASSDETSGNVTLWADETGTITLFGLPSGRTFTTEVVDPFGHVLERVAIQPLGDQEEREITLPVQADPTEFSGLVTDSEGTPIGGIDVEVVGLDGKGQHGVTSLSGRFDVREFCGSSARITVGGGGWSEVTRVLAPIPRGQVVHITLQPSTSLVVRVQAHDTEVLADLKVAAHAAGSESSWRGSRMQDDRWVLHGLPLGVVSVEADSDVTFARTEVDTRTTTEIVLRLAPKVD